MIRFAGDALIEYEDPYAAAAAVRMKDGVELHGAKIKVHEGITARATRFGFPVVCITRRERMLVS